MPSSDSRGELVPSTSNPVAVPGRLVRTLQLGDKAELDLTNLTSQKADALEAKAHELAIERDDRRTRLQEDLSVMASQLNNFAKAVGDATNAGAAVTITNTKEDSLGRTEMILGNSAAAHTGKLSRSQQGFGDNARLWIILASIAAIAIILVAALKR